MRGLATDPQQPLGIIAAWYREPRCLVPLVAIATLVFLLSCIGYRLRLAGRLAAWYERFPYPRLVLSVVVLALYGSSIRMPFFIDDYRNLRLMDEYRAGRRASLDLYRFFTTTEEITAQRNACYLPWWIADNVRAQLMRPVAEYNLYLDYLVWGKNPAGHHAMSLLMYVISVWLLLTLFRTVQSDESRARWATLIYALAASNAITVTFLAARCDLLAVLGGLIAMLAGLRFATAAGGRFVWVPVAALACLTALLSKEAATPISVGFGLLWWIARTKIEPSQRRTHDRRAFILLGLLMVVNILWLGIRFAGKYETNATFMLDPVRHPGEYLREAPFRILQYLIAWPMPVNPTIFHQHPTGRVPLILMTSIATAIVAILLLFFRRRYRHDISVWGFAAWAFMFLPVLACTMPDARLLMLPFVGFAYLSAVWICTCYDAGSWFRRARGWLLLRFIPVVLLILFPIPISMVTTRLFIGELERKAVADLTFIAGEIERSPGLNAGTQRPAVFIVSIPRGFQNAWPQDRALYALGPNAPTISPLCDLWKVDYEVTGPNTLRLKEVDMPFISTLLGQFGVPGGTIFHIDDQFTVPEFSVKVSGIANGRPTTLDLTFREPLDSPRYFFYYLSGNEPPWRWRPQPGERIRFTETDAPSKRPQTAKPVVGKPA